MKQVVIVQTDAFRNMAQFIQFRSDAEAAGFAVLTVAPEAIGKVRIEAAATLRDQFAMAALASLDVSLPVDVAAKNCWAMADAMLVAREVKEESNAR